VRVKRSILVPIVASIVVVLIAYYVIYAPFNQAENNRSTHSKMGNSDLGFQTIFNETIQVKDGNTVNISINLGNYPCLCGISLTGNSNNTPALLYLESHGIFYDEITLANEKCAFGAQTTFADSPYVTLHGGIWYLNIEQVTENGQIHVIVKFRPP
jgi:hypothetical protein